MSDLEPRMEDQSFRESQELRLTVRHFAKYLKGSIDPTKFTQNTAERRRSYSEPIQLVASILKRINDSKLRESTCCLSAGYFFRFRFCWVNGYIWSEGKG